MTSIGKMDMRKRFSAGQVIKYDGDAHREFTHSMEPVYGVISSVSKKEFVVDLERPKKTNYFDLTLTVKDPNVVELIPEPFATEVRDRIW